jgi:hypothetical protein
MFAEVRVSAFDCLRGLQMSLVKVFHRLLKLPADATNDTRTKEDETERAHDRAYWSTWTWM